MRVSTKARHAITAMMHLAAHHGRGPLALADIAQVLGRSLSAACWDSLPPPHTRGSTRDLRAYRSRDGASPAHAGIDLRVSAKSPVVICLPRTRGDRPGADASTMAHTPPPPHTRGSTCCGLHAVKIGQASPAHAGIDPHDLLANGALYSLPRTRGDRPMPFDQQAERIKPPPHTRGSTHPPRPHPRPRPASPAHAGIDHKNPNLSLDDIRLPRTRGDRPRHCIACPRRSGPPPHTRGSTRAYTTG